MDPFFYGLHILLLHLEDTVRTRFGHGPRRWTKPCQQGWEEAEEFDTSLVFLRGHGDKMCGRRDFHRLSFKLTVWGRWA